MCQKTTRANLHYDNCGVIKTGRLNMQIRTLNGPVFTNVQYEFVKSGGFISTHGKVWLMWEVELDKKDYINP